MNDIAIHHNLQQRWHALQQQAPALRIREAAQQLAVSEAELLATRCGGQGVIRLAGPWSEVFQALPTLGRVMVLTRNEHCVHERKGLYHNLSVQGPMGLVVGEDIDLRVFFSHWAYGFAVEEQSPAGLRRSLQFFDKDGTAVHKVYLQGDDHEAQFHTLVARFSNDDQSHSQRVEALPAAQHPDSDSVDWAAFRQDWAALRDTHDFFPMLKRYGISRQQAVAHAGEPWTRQVSNDSARQLLALAAEQVLPIMVFVGSAGVVQIHTGPVQNLKATGPWFNVLDADFNLHLRETGIASSWVVRKPSDDGIVTALEVLDAQGELIVQFFGKRKPGIPEDPHWTALVERLA